MAAFSGAGREYGTMAGRRIIEAADHSNDAQDE